MIRKPISAVTRCVLRQNDSPLAKFPSTGHGARSGTNFITSSEAASWIA